MDKFSKQITVAEMAPHVHSFSPNENKTEKIFNWLKNWIENSLNQGNINYGDRLPLKGDLAFHIGVSLGTIQNVFRLLEDAELIESKQRVGTYIKKPEVKKTTEKLTSKKDTAVEEIKKFILKNKLQIGEAVISTRKLGEKLNLSGATIRAALTYLVYQGILEKKQNTFIIKKINFKIKEVECKTLTEKIAEKIQANLKEIAPKGKIPSNKDLAKKYKVSIKTVHDSIKLLNKSGILNSRRGQYGTVIAEENKNAFYYYEEIEIKVKHFITKNCQIGDKLPSIINFAKMYGVSTKTIKKALDNLADDGYITYTRGRYGGTFVTDIPQSVKESYKWLAIASDYVFESEN